MNIEHHYIRIKRASDRIDKPYIPTLEIIIDIMTNMFTNAKFYLFVYQMYIT